MPLLQRYDGEWIIDSGGKMDSKEKEKGDKKVNSLRLSYGAHIVTTMLCQVLLSTTHILTNMMWAVSCHGALGSHRYVFFFSEHKEKHK